MTSSADFTKITLADGNVLVGVIDALVDRKEFNVLRYGAKGDGVTDDTAALQAASDAVKAAGGGTVFVPQGQYKISAKVWFDSGVDLVGAGDGGTASGSEKDATRFVCSTVDAGLVFGNYIYTSSNYASNPTSPPGVRGAYSGHFGVDGANVATMPIYFGHTVDRQFSGIMSYNSAGAGFYMHAGQNSVYQQMRSMYSASHAFDVDFGFSGNTMVLCTTHRPGGSAVAFKQSNGTTSVPSAALSTQNNTFIGCLLERMTATTTAIVLAESSNMNKFVGTNFNVGLLDDDETASGGIPCVKLTTPTGSISNLIVINNCRFFGGSSPYKHWGIETGGTRCQVDVSGFSSFYSLLAAVYSSSTSTTSHRIRLGGPIELVGGTANLTKSGSAANLLSTTMRAEFSSPLKTNDALELAGWAQFDNQAAAPAAAASTVMLYALKDANGKMQLNARTPNGVVTTLVQE